MGQGQATQRVLAQFECAMEDEDNALVRVASCGEPRLDFARSVVAGLVQRPRRLECRFLYDAKGSELFEEICAQPEYYQTRTEAALLERHAADIAQHTGPVTLVELGSGSSVKTDLLLSAYAERAEGVTYVPIDVSFAALKEAIGRLGLKRPEVQVVGVHGTYEDAFPLLASASPNLVVFLGSTIGNFSQPEAEEFWGQLGEHLGPGDHVLLGVDLVKEPSVLEAAYNDEAGVTAAFTNNLFARMNRELDSGLDLDTITHEAHWNAGAEQVEIHARFKGAQTLRVSPLDTEVPIAADERVLVEISRKFRLDTLEPQLAGYGFALQHCFTDPRGWFGLLMLRRRSRP